MCACACVCTCACVCACAFSVLQFAVYAFKTVEAALRAAVDTPACSNSPCCSACAAASLQVMFMSCKGIFVVGWSVVYCVEGSGMWVSCSLGSRPSPYVRILIARGWANRSSGKAWDDSSHEA